MPTGTATRSIKIMEEMESFKVGQSRFSSSSETGL